MAFVATSDLPRARNFYRNILGLEVVESTSFGCVVNAGGNLVRLTPVEGFQPASYTVLGWRVDDIDFAVRSLMRRRITFHRYPGLEQDECGIWTTPDGDGRVAWFDDPDGNVLSLTQSG